MTPISKRKSILLARQAALLSRIGGISDELGSHQEKVDLFTPWRPKPIMGDRAKWAMFGLTL